MGGDEFWIPDFENLLPQWLLIICNQFGSMLGKPSQAFGWTTPWCGLLPDWVTPSVHSAALLPHRSRRDSKLLCLLWSPYQIYVDSWGESQKMLKSRKEFEMGILWISLIFTLPCWWLYIILHVIILHAFTCDFTSISFEIISTFSLINCLSFSSYEPEFGGTELYEEVHFGVMFANTSETS